MSTLVTAGNSDGVYGRCDAKCHNAAKPECDCICGGRYHGKKAGSPELAEAVRTFQREIMAQPGARGQLALI